MKQSLTNPPHYSGNALARAHNQIIIITLIHNISVLLNMSVKDGST